MNGWRYVQQFFKWSQTLYYYIQVTTIKPSQEIIANDTAKDIDIRLGTHPLKNFPNKNANR